MGRENTYRRIPQIPGQVDKTTLNELYRQFSEMIYAGEGRRGPIEKKDSLNITASDRHSPLRFSGTGNRGSGAISFGGVNNASMFIAKGAYMNDQGSWVAEDGTAVIQEMNRNSLTPIMYRNEGLQIGQIFTPTSVGGVVVGSTPPGGGGSSPIPAIALNELTDVIITGVVDGQVLVYDAGIGQWVNITLDHGDLTGLLDKDHPLYQRKHGFDLSSSGAPLQTITYDKNTQVVTVTPVGANFTFWIDGVQFTKTGAQVAPAHGLVTGKYFIYYDSAGVLQTSAVETPWSIRDRTVTPVALVYWNNALADGICFYECHTADRILEFHYRDHFALGTQYISGGELTGYTPLLDTDAGVTYAIGSGIIADEDIRFEFGNIPDGGPYVIFYRTGGTGVWTWDATQVFPFLSGATYPSWNNPNGGGAGVWGMTETSGAALGTYVNYFVCATSAVTPAAASGFLIPGQASHATLAAAQTEYLTGLSLGTLPFEEVRGIWRVTIRARNTYGGTHDCVIQEVTKITSQSVTVSGGSPGITDHGGLTGLLDDDHTQYQLRSEQGVAAGYPTLDANAVVEEPVKLYRQGLDAAVPALAEGELYWATDTDTLYIGT